MLHSKNNKNNETKSVSYYKMMLKVPQNFENHNSWINYLNTNTNIYSI